MSSAHHLPADPLDPAPEMPNGLHIAIVVYGTTFSELLAEVTLPNLAAMVREIPQELRAKSKVRILTTPADMPTIFGSAVLPTLRREIAVEIVDKATLTGHDKHGDYGPMVETQRRVVVDAAHDGAAIIFVGPDLIFNRGAFALFVDRLRAGYRLIVGPGPRVKREAIRPHLRSRIASSEDGTFALEPAEQIDLFFRHWHPINDKFLLESDEGIWWKAYVCHRPRIDHLLFRLIQGPTFLAWPLRPADDFDGFIDHQLPELCCRSWREIYVVPDGAECLPLDMTDDSRPDIMELSDFPRVFLLKELFEYAAIKDLKLRYAFRTSYVHRGDADPELVRQWYRRFSRAIDPLLVLAIAERAVRRRFGRWAGRIFKTVCILNTHTFSFLLAPVAMRVARRWQAVFPLDTSGQRR